MQRIFDYLSVQRRYVFRLLLRGLTTLDEQRQLSSSVDRLRSEALESAAIVQSLERQVAVHSVELALARGDMTWVEEFITIAQCQMFDAQSALLTLEGECNKYRHRLSVHENWVVVWRGGLVLLVIAWSIKRL